MHLNQFRGVALHNATVLSWFGFLTRLRFHGPVAILYFVQVTGSFALGGLVLAAATVAAALSEVPTGVLSDRMERRHVATLGAIAASLSFALYALGGSMWLLLIGAVVEGFAAALWSGNNEALVYESVASEGQPEQYGAALARMQSFQEAAAAVAALLGSAVAFWSFPATLWLSAVAQLGAAILSRRLQEPTVHSRRSGNLYAHLDEAIRAFWRNPRLQLLAAAGSLSYAVGESSFQFQAAFVQTIWPVWAIGVTRTISSVLSITSFWFSTRIIARLTPLGAVIAGNLYGRFIHLLALLHPTVVSPAILAGVSLAHGVGTVARSQLLQEEFSDGVRATMGSLVSFTGSLLFGVVAVLVGSLADRFGPATALLIMQVPQLLQPLLYWRIHVLGQRAATARVA